MLSIFREVVIALLSAYILERPDAELYIYNIGDTPSCSANLLYGVEPE
jgi:hypothetical protein